MFLKNIFFNYFMKKEKRVFQINIPGRLFYTLVILGVLILLGAGVYAKVTAGSIPDPGHNIQSIGAPNSCDYGEYLVYDSNPGCGSEAVPGVANSGSGPCWECKALPVDDLSSMGWEIVTASASTSRGAECPSGKRVLGGGCACPGGYVEASYPADNNRWVCTCASSSSPSVQYAICAKY